MESWGWDDRLRCWRPVRRRKDLRDLREGTLHHTPSREQLGCFDPGEPLRNPLNRLDEITNVVRGYVQLSFSDDSP